MLELEFFVQGDPAPQGNKRIGAHGQLYESSKRLKPWREAIAWQTLVSRKGKIISGVVEVTAHFWTRRDADLDKLLRGLFDGIVEGGAIEDDMKIVRVYAGKTKGPSPSHGTHGCKVSIRPA